MQNLSELEIILLKNRDIPEEEWETFLHPDYNSQTHDPYLMKDMEKSVVRILQAIESKEKIGIFSDYDADGVPGAVMMKDFFDRIHYENVVFYIPDRHLEGFGLNSEAVSFFKNEGVKLLMTIDCGITDVEEVNEANAFGMDVIISDHHLPSKIIPEAFAILDPKQEGDDYPEKMLCGTAVAYKFIQAILLKKDFGLGKGQEKWFLDMVGIATLSDMVPLLGENRVLAKFGLRVFKKSRRPGLLALLKRAGVDQKNLVEDDVGFLIAPRINAASRMGHAMDAFKLLSSKDEKESGELALYLENLNKERKTIVARMVKEMKASLHNRIDREIERGIIVLGNPSWRPSLLGLAANNLAEEHNLPVFLWGKEDGEIIKGSCRSNGKVNVFEVMQSVEKDIFIDFGGHALSGGFSIYDEKIHIFEDAISKAMSLQNVENVESKEVLFDTTLSLSEVNRKTSSLIENLSPYGIGNPKPVFLFKDVTVKSIAQFGKEKNHLKLILEQNNTKNIEAIAFFSDEKSFEKSILEDSKSNILASVEKSNFRGREEFRLRLVDVV